MMFSIDEVRRGLEREEFFFYYQPKVDFITGRACGAEALVRWRHNDDVLLSPSEFIPVAESAGMVPEITRRLFPRFVKDFQTIQEQAPGPTLSFNVCADDLDGTGLLGTIREHLNKGGIRADKVELEVTEGSRIPDTEASRRTISGLLAAGVGFSMDDYGTGFSSLETLKRLPFSAIKLDQGFVMEMLRSSKSATLVKTSIAAAQMLGIKTVVEGVDSDAVYRSLLHSGCSEGQGYWISPPMPIDEYLDFVRRDQSWPCSPVGMLRMAQIAHTWQYKLLVDLLCTIVRQEKVEVETLEQMHIDHHSCSLGRWYYGAGQMFADDPEYQALEGPHRQMHETCELIVSTLAEKGAAPKVRALLGGLSQKAVEVTGALERLETRLLIDELCSAEEPSATGE